MSGVGSAVSVVSYRSEQRYSPKVLGASFALTDALLSPVAAEAPHERLAVDNHAGRALIAADGSCWGCAEYTILQAERAVTRDHAGVGSYFEVEVQSAGAFVAGFKGFNSAPTPLVHANADTPATPATPAASGTSASTDEEGKRNDAEVDEKLSERRSFLEVQNLLLAAVARAQRAFLRCDAATTHPPELLALQSDSAPPADGAEARAGSAEESVRIPDWFHSDSLQTWDATRLGDVIAIGTCLALPLPPCCLPPFRIHSRVHASINYSISSHHFDSSHASRSLGRRVGRFIAAR